MKKRMGSLFLGAMMVFRRLLQGMQWTYLEAVGAAAAER